MKSNTLLNGRFRPLAGLLLRVATLGVFAGSAPAWAVDPTVFPNLSSGQYCMGDVAGGKVNCTANDVSITAVSPSPDANGNPIKVSCSPGTTFTFDAEVTVQTTASARYDTTFYLPQTAKSPKEVQGKQCGILLPVAPPTTAPNVAPYQSYVRIDNDSCADITKSVGPGSYVIHKVPITMFCQAAPAPNQNKALFSYCAAWDNKEVNGNCKGTSGGTLTDFAGAAPGTPSKCNCASFVIDVEIIPPGISKTVDQPTSRPESGGAFTYHLSFTNQSSVAINLTSLQDAIDLGNNGYDSNLTVDLWGATKTDVEIDALPDGVYLRSTNCQKPTPPATTYSVAAGATYSCDFTLRIKDRDLPNDQSPEIYDDTVVGRFMTQGNPSLPVGDGTTCSTETNFRNPGNICSQEQSVMITNVAPSITVTKTPNPDQLSEPGGSVEYTVVVSNTSGDFDDPLTLTSLIDDKFGNLNAKGDCALGSGVSLAKSTPFSCKFTETISGNSGDPAHINKVTATALDNEGDDATADDTATVSIVDVPSAIHLEKDANPESVAETGDKTDLFRDVAYTFTFSVNESGVDAVTFSSLTDDKFGPLTGDCMVNKKNGADVDPPEALNGFVLIPGENASCTITKQLQGDYPGSHTNVATIYGKDADGVELQDDDPATVTFTDELPTMDKGFALKATVFLKVKNTSVDTLHLTALQILGVPVEDGHVFAPSGFVIRNDGGDFGPFSPGVCLEPPYSLVPPYSLTLAPDGEYDCAFSVEFAQVYTPSKFNTFTSTITGSDAVKVEFADDEGNPVSGVAEVTITTP